MEIIATRDRPAATASLRRATVGETNAVRDAPTESMTDGIEGGGAST
jgi:hypothetical protein